MSLFARTCLPGVPLATGCGSVCPTRSVHPSAHFRLDLRHRLTRDEGRVLRHRRDRREARVCDDWLVAPGIHVCDVCWKRATNGGQLLQDLSARVSCGSDRSRCRRSCDRADYTCQQGTPSGASGAPETTDDQPCSGGPSRELLNIFGVRGHSSSFLTSASSSMGNAD